MTALAPAFGASLLACQPPEAEPHRELPGEGSTDAGSGPASPTTASDTGPEVLDTDAHDAGDPAPDCATWAAWSRAASRSGSSTLAGTYHAWDCPDCEPVAGSITLTATTLPDGALDLRDYRFDRTDGSTVIWRVGATGPPVLLR